MAPAEQWTLMEKGELNSKHTVAHWAGVFSRAFFKLAEPGHPTFQYSNNPTGQYASVVLDHLNSRLDL